MNIVVTRFGVRDSVRSPCPQPQHCAQHQLLPRGLSIVVSPSKMADWQDFHDEVQASLSMSLSADYSTICRVTAYRSCNSRKWPLDKVDSTCSNTGVAKTRTRRKARTTTLVMINKTISFTWLTRQEQFHSIARFITSSSCLFPISFGEDTEELFA